MSSSNSSSTDIVTAISSTIESLISLRAAIHAAGQPVQRQARKSPTTPPTPTDAATTPARAPAWRMSGEEKHCIFAGPQTRATVMPDQFGPGWIVLSCVDGVNGKPTKAQSVEEGKLLAEDLLGITSAKTAAPAAAEDANW